MKKIVLKKKISKKVEKKEGFNLSKEYRKSWDYIKDSRIFICAVILIFLFFILIGFFLPAPPLIYNAIVNYIKNILAQTENMSLLNTIFFIIYNNIQSTFFVILFGIFFGIFPLLNTIINGYVLGFVSSISVAQDGILILWRLLPHGIFELPAVFISLGLGLRTGMFIFQKDKMESLKNYLINSFKVFVLIIIPLIIVAGVIEGILVFVLK